MSKENGTLFSDVPDYGFEGVAHKIPARGLPRLLIEVEVMPANGTTVASQHVPRGTHKVIIYKDELPNVEKKVATDEHKASWKTAEITFERMLTNHVDKIVGKKDDMNVLNPAYMQRRRDEEEKYGLASVAGLFCNMFPTGMPPILSLKVLKEIAPPVTKENETDSKIDKLVNALASTQNKDAENRIKELEDKLNQMMALLEKKTK